MDHATFFSEATLIEIGVYPNTLHFINEVSHRDFDLLVGRSFLKALKMH